VAKIGYKWLQLTDFQTFFGYFHVFLVVEHIKSVLERLHLKNEIFQKNRKIPFLVKFGQF
jgi:hypothetical protein